MNELNKPLPASQEPRQNCRHCGKEEPNYAAMTAQAAAYSQIGCPKNSSGMHIWESTISSTPVVPVEPRCTVAHDYQEFIDPQIGGFSRCRNCGHEVSEMELTEEDGL